MVTSKFELTGCLERAQIENDEVTAEQPCVQDKNESEVQCGVHRVLFRGALCSKNPTRGGKDH